MKSPLAIHWCLLHRSCREFARPGARLYLHVFGWTVMIGTPAGKSQGWRPSIGATDQWHYVSVHPSDFWKCGHRFDGGVICGRHRWHRGDHFDWRDGPTGKLIERLREEVGHAQ